MEWRWERTEDAIDDKGRPTKVVVLDATPIEDARKVRVAVYRTKEKRHG